MPGGPGLRFGLSSPQVLTLASGRPRGGNCGCLAAAPRPAPRSAGSPAAVTGPRTVAVAGVGWLAQAPAGDAVVARPSVTLLLVATAALLVLGAALLVLLRSRAVTRQLDLQRQLEDNLLDSLPVLVLTADGEGGVQRLNRRAAQLLGLDESPPGCIPAARWLARVHRDDRTSLQGAMRAVLDGTASSAEAEMRVSDRDGVTRWLNARIHGVPSPPDGDTRLAIVATETTDLVLARQTGEARQARLAFLSDVAQTVAGEVAETRILDRFLELAEERFSVVALHLLRPLPGSHGLRLAAGRGAAAEAIVGCWDRLSTRNPCWLAYRDGVPHMATPADVIPADEAERLASSHGVRHLLAIPLLAAGQVIGVLGMASASRLDPVADDPDLFTQIGILLGGAIHLSQLVVQLEEQRALALEASRLKSEFLANTSHELRTPLTSILGFLRLVIDGAVPEPSKQREFLCLAHESAEKLLTIINDVLDLARIEAGRLEVFPAAVPLGQVLDEAEQLFGQQMRGKGLDFKVVDDARSRVVWADPHRTLQILTNLLGNAVKFTPLGGSVTLSSDDDGREVTLTVEDTGIGISPGELEKVFTAFYQVDGTTTRHYGGAGLGLTISRRLAELMGGRLDLESAGQGLGTRAILHLQVPGDGATDG